VGFVEAERAAVCNVQASGSQEGTLLGGKWYPDTAKSTSEQVPSRTFPSPEAVAAADGFVLDELYEAFELIRSYAVSGMEAAGRGDRDEIRLRLRIQLRDAFRYTVKLHDLLSPEKRKEGAS
jgi:hypothetical protein